MEKETRKQLIADLRKYHEGTLNSLGKPAGYFCCKHGHIPENMDIKCIGLFDSEVSKGDDVFIEFTSMDYKPSDAARRLYKWEHNPHYKDAYNRNEKTSQWLIPTSELHVVSSPTVNKVEGKVYKDVRTAYLTEVNAFTKEVLEETTYRKEVYVAANGTRHEITFKNGIPHTYLHNGIPNGQSFNMADPIALQETIEFFQQLKY